MLLLQVRLGATGWPAVVRSEDPREPQRLPAVRADQHLRGRRGTSGGRWRLQIGDALLQKQLAADAGEQVAIAHPKEPVLAHLHKALGQHVLQKALDER